jgi:hypothetical protein
MNRCREGVLVIAESIGCLCKCNPHIFFAIGSGANAAFRLMQRRLRRARRTAAARHPYLGITRGAAAPWCGSTIRKTNGRAAAPSGAQDSGANAAFRLMQRRLRRARRTAARHPYLGITRGAAAPLYRPLAKPSSLHWRSSRGASHCVLCALCVLGGQFCCILVAQRPAVPHGKPIKAR